MFPTPGWRWDAAACASGLVLATCVGWVLRLQSARTHQRGTRVIAGRQARRQIRARRRRCTAQAVTLAGTPIAALEETRHFKLIGTTGTGKSTAIRGLLSQVLRRGDRAVIADPDCGYLARFHDGCRQDVSHRYGRYG